MILKFFVQIPQKCTGFFVMGYAFNLLRLSERAFIIQIDLTENGERCYGQ